MDQQHFQDSLEQLPESSAEYIQLPALTGGVGSMLLALKYQTDESQWWSGEQLRSMQQRQLAELLESSWHGVPFYRNRLQQAGYRPGRKLTEKVWRRVPVLRREDLQNQGERLGNKACPESHGKLTWVQSSGSTGTPVRVSASELSQYVTNALSLRVHHWHGQDLTGRLAIIRYLPGVPPEGLRREFWSQSTRTIYRTGPSFSLDIRTPVETQAEWLLQVNPHYLLTYPTHLQALIEHSRDRSLSLPALRQVQVISETLNPQVRSLCREQWGVEVIDGYSAQETGLLALQCPDHDHLHIQAESILLEVLDAAGRPCKAGEIGRVVVTPLHNFAMPLIRYEIGDHAQLGGPCGCGRGLQVLNRIMGRTRNMLRLPDGRSQWPSIGIVNYTDAAGVTIRQAQVVQHTLEQVELRLVTASPLSKTQESAVVEVLREALGYPFEVKVSYPEVISRSSSGKYEDFLSML